MQRGFLSWVNDLSCQEWLCLRVGHLLVFQLKQWKKYKILDTYLGRRKHLIKMTCTRQVSGIGRKVILDTP